MRKTVIILVLLAGFAITRNVLVVSSAPSTASSATTDMQAAAPDRAPQFPLSGIPFDPVAQAPGTLSLFVAGIAGLMAAGGRRADRQRDSARAS